MEGASERVTSTADAAPPALPTQAELPDKQEVVNAETTAEVALQALPTQARSTKPRQKKAKTDSSEAPTADAAPPTLPTQAEHDRGWQ